MTIVRSCPKCGRPLVLRTNGATGEEFLGCSQWPQCTYTTPLTPDLVMRRAGATELPGFGVDR